VWARTIRAGAWRGLRRFDGRYGRISVSTPGHVMIRSRRSAGSPGQDGSPQRSQAWRPSWGDRHHRRCALGLDFQRGTGGCALTGTLRHERCWSGVPGARSRGCVAQASARSRDAAMAVSDVCVDSQALAGSGVSAGHRCAQAFLSAAAVAVLEACAVAEALVSGGRFTRSCARSTRMV